MGYVSENSESETEKEHGIAVMCKTMAGYETHFRCILREQDLDAFKDAIRRVSREHNADNLHKSNITINLQASPTKLVNVQSIMRRSIAKAMDSFDVRSVKDRIVARRGAMKFLPVYFANDLVHGSWSVFCPYILFICKVY